MIVWVRALTLDDFRSYTHLECPFVPGVNVLLGRNGQGKTNVLEAIGYVATHHSHRTASDSLLVRRDAPRARISCLIESDGQRAAIDLAVIPGRPNRARLNGVNLPRAGDALGLLKTVTFAPEDLALVKGDPAVRRAFLDDLLVQRHPRVNSVIAEFERALRQRNALLKSARERRTAPASLESSLVVWDEQMAQAGAELVASRVRLIGELAKPFHDAYAHLTEEAPDALRGAAMAYRATWINDHADGVRGDVSAHVSAHVSAAPSVDASVDAAGSSPPTSDVVGAEVSASEISGALHRALQQARSSDLARGVTTVGPQRDELDITLDGVLARGYASHGESWSLALALRLSAYELFTRLGPAPVLLLDDVFAELDTRRRERLISAIREAEQIIVTAAVEEDVPPLPNAQILDVSAGQVLARGDA